MKFMKYNLNMLHYLMNFNKLIMKCAIHFRMYRFSDAKIHFYNIKFLKQCLLMVNYGFLLC